MNFAWKVFFIVLIWCPFWNNRDSYHPYWTNGGTYTSQCLTDVLVACVGFKGLQFFLLDQCQHHNMWVKCFYYSFIRVFLVNSFYWFDPCKLLSYQLPFNDACCRICYYSYHVLKFFSLDIQLVCALSEPRAPLAPLPSCSFIFTPLTSPSSAWEPVQF